MNKNLLLITVGLSIFPGMVFAQAARDWHDFHKFHEHIDQAIYEVEIARQANHYGMAGYGGKSEDYLRLAEQELSLADNSTNSGQQKGEGNVKTYPQK